MKLAIFSVLEGKASGEGYKFSESTWRLPDSSTQRNGDGRKSASGSWALTQRQPQVTTTIHPLFYKENSCLAPQRISSEIEKYGFNASGKRGKP